MKHRIIPEHTHQNTDLQPSQIDYIYQTIVIQIKGHFGILSKIYINCETFYIVHYITQNTVSTYTEESLIDMFLESHAQIYAFDSPFEAINYIHDQLTLDRRQQ